MAKKRVSTKTYKVTAKKVAVGCPMWAAVSAAITDGSFKASVVIGKTATGYYLFADDASDATKAFAKINAIETLEDESISDADIPAILDEYVGKDHEVQIDAVAGTLVSGTLCKIEVIDTSRKKSTASVKGDGYASIMQEHVNEMVSCGAMNEEVGKKIMEVLEENKILEDASLCEQLYGYWKRHWEKFGDKDPKKTQIPTPVYKDPALEESIKDHNEGIISEGLRCALSGHGLVAQGGKSVGKNIWSSTIAMLLNVPYSLLTFSRSMAPSAIYGEKSTDNSASEKLYSAEAHDLAVSSLDGDNLEAIADFELLKARASSVRIVQDQSELFDALQYGRVMIFNEMNMADPNLFASFVNQILDGTGFLFIPGRGEVEIPREFVFIGTQNEDYEGTEQQNEATMSRLAALTFPQPKTIIPQLQAAVEAAIKQNGIRTIDDDFTKEADKIYKQVEKYYEACKSMSVDDGRTNYADLVSEAVLNIRGFIRAIVEYLEAGGHTTLKRKIEMHVISTCPVDERASLKTIMPQYITV